MALMTSPYKSAAGRPTYKATPSKYQPDMLTQSIVACHQRVCILAMVQAYILWQLYIRGQADSHDFTR
jgi:hypothetical protein